MEWLPTAVAVEARRAHLVAEAERRALVRLARGTLHPVLPRRAWRPSRLHPRLIRRLAGASRRTAVRPDATSVRSVIVDGRQVLAER